MTQFTTLNLKDDSASEVAFTVEGINYQTNVASWVNVGSFYDESPRATFSLVPPTARASRARVRAKVTIPIMDSVSGAIKVDELIANVEFVLPKNSNLNQRKNLRAFLVDFVNDNVVINAIQNFESVY